MTASAFLKLAVIGDPVDHSKSPALHTTFLADAGIAGSYEAIRVTKPEVEIALSRLSEDGYTGLNVTTPLKEAVLPLCTERDELAAEIDAANTLTLGGVRGAWSASNTDVEGARIAAETALGTSLRGKCLLVLGAGPASRAAIVAFRNAGAETLVWSRSLERAETVARHLQVGIWTPRSEACELAFSGLPPNPALPKTLHDELQRARLVIDANYSSRATLGATLDRAVISGESMLEAQARASFRIWRNALPEIHP